MDFGLYIENKTYADAKPATLKKIDVQATQTQFIFQCGEVDLQIDFVSPSLSEKWALTGWACAVLFPIKSVRKAERNIQWKSCLMWIWNGCLARGKLIVGLNRIGVL